LPPAALVVMGAGMVKLSSTPEVLVALARAQEIDLQGYTLGRTIVHALEAAASHGAHVVVELEGRPHNDPNGGLARENRQLVRRLRSAGVDARLADPVHAKTIRADGTLYLDDKNWNMPDLVLRDDDPTDAKSIPMTKSGALKEEGRLLRAARADDGVIVASESFGRGNSVYSALAALAGSQAHPRLIVCERELRGNARERDTLLQLARAGVRVRVCNDTEKLALAGDRAWIGSANATIAFGRSNLPDWGLRSSDPTIVQAVRDRIESEWASAKDFGPA
jgi:hypothetical protein